MFAGSALALVAAAAIAVLVGEALTRVVPPEWLRRAAGATFVVLGLLFLLTGGAPETTPTEGTEQTPNDDG